MPTIVHFEIPADNVKRAAKFYSGVFGWKLKEFPKMQYWHVMTTGKKPVHGGMMKRQKKSQPITNYIGVASAAKSAAKVEAAGGKVVVPKTAIPAIGYFAICKDTEGNVFGLFEDDKKAK